MLGLDLGLDGSRLRFFAGSALLEDVEEAERQLAEALAESARLKKGGG